jgi:hypothetical protein
MVAIASLVGVAACASKPVTIADVLGKLPAARPEEPVRIEERLMRMTLEHAIAANELPAERPLVLLKSPWGNARVLPAQGPRVVILSYPEMAQLAQRHGGFPYIYLRLENREGSHKTSIDQKGIEPDQTSARVTLFVLVATPPDDGGELTVICPDPVFVYRYAKRGADWVLESSPSSD